MEATSSSAPLAALGSQYAQLSRQVRQAGLLGRRGGYYAARFATVAALLTGAWTAFVLIGESWWQVCTAAIMAVLFTQVGFLGHDAGHRQIFRSRRANDLAGLLQANLIIGLSYGWWIDKHNRHHAHPNHEELDPDVAPAGPLVFLHGQATGRRGLYAWLTRHQAVVFFPILLLEGLNLHVSSFQALRDGTVTARWREGGLLAVHLVAFVGAPFLVLSFWQALASLAVHQAVFGFYMGCSFAPNHKGMPPLTDEEEKDYLRRQVLTSRNVRGGRFTDWLLGGLNYQIEHHLFPSMPRPNLRRAKPLVERFCAERGVRYAETGLLDSYGQVLRHLHEVGEPARA
jgi:fatty acid desaturase